MADYGLDWIARALESGHSITDLHKTPRGAFQGHIGATGRLKLPAEIYRYLIRVTDDNEGVFITSLDMKSIRVYTLKTWQRNQEILAGFTEDVQAANTIDFIANALGRDSDLDEQGRILIPVDIRRKLGLEDQDVYMTCRKGCVSIYGQKQFDERLAQAVEQAPSALEKVEKAGFL